MARRRRSYKRFFRSKRKGTSWTKETFNLLTGISFPIGQPVASYVLPIVQNGPNANGAANVQTASYGLRTVKNFVLSGFLSAGLAPDDVLQTAYLNMTGQNNLPEGVVFSDSMRLVAQQRISYAKEQVCVRWALVYQPAVQGNIQNLVLSFQNGISIFEPNQHIIDSGIWSPTAGPLRINCRMARKLHTGDQIVLLIQANYPGFLNTPASVTIGTFNAVVSYCVKCN